MDYPSGSRCAGFISWRVCWGFGRSILGVDGKSLPVVVLLGFYGRDDLRPSQVFCTFPAGSRVVEIDRLPGMSTSVVSCVFAASGSRMLFSSLGGFHYFPCVCGEFYVCPVVTGFIGASVELFVVVVSADSFYWRL